MARRFLPVKAAALAAAGFLLIGGPAVAAPDSNNDKGGGKPSSAASGKSSGNSGSNPGNSGSNPGVSGSKPSNSGSNPGKPAATPGGASSGPATPGPKDLPDTASAVAGAATAKTNPAASGTPNSFGKSVAAAASSQQAQGTSVDVEIPSATSAPTAIPSPVTPATVTVPVDAATTVTPSAPGSDPDSNRVRGTDRSGASPSAPAQPAGKPATTADAEVGPQQRTAASPATAAPAAAALSLTPPRTPPQSTGDAPGINPAGAQGSWLGRVAGHVADEVRAALRQVTLKELALAALPGLAGILFCLATGIGLGHRQAKFGFALESTGALRFAIRGPIGVVRPGGFISLPTRAGKPRSVGSRSALADRAA